MGYINNIHNTEGYKVISGFGNTFICDNAIDANKTIIFPDGWNNDTNLSFKVVFKYGHNCTDDQTYMTLNSIPIVVNQYGTLIPLPIHEMDDSGTTKYKSLQPNTILEMYYTNDYDGNNNPAYVVIGNPIVLSSSDYTIYANGQIGGDQYIRNQNSPDWSNAQLMTLTNLSCTAPSDGWFMGYVIVSGTGYCTAKLNGIGISWGFGQKDHSDDGLSIQVKVNQGDVLTIEKTSGIYGTDNEIYFVPHK